jgi:hypothetical protein
MSREPALGRFKMRSKLIALLLCLVWVASASAQPQQTSPKTGLEEIEGYAEWRKGELLIIDGQRVKNTPKTRFKGKNQAKSFDTIPLGYEVKAKGIRLANGVFEAQEIEAKPNGKALYEAEAIQTTNTLERLFLSSGRLPKEMGNYRLLTSGSEVGRVRTIADKLIPPYRRTSDFRIYVTEDPEWNAFAAANGMIVVNRGLLKDMDNDEVAIVLGHELVHATHEHTRRQMKKGLWIGIIGAAGAVASQEIKNDKARKGASIAVALSTLAWSNSYSRDLEDQADRVGLRYAYEAGFDVSKGPRLWLRFSEKYGERSKVENFFFGNHSLSQDRAKKLQYQMTLNYPDVARRISGMWDLAK